MNVVDGIEDHPIQWFGPHLTGNELNHLGDVLARNYINDGPLAREFERRTAALIGVRHAVAVTSGTAAISLALMGYGIGAGDEVIVPDLTFIATANAVRMTGASVRLVDVEPERFCLDWRQIEKVKTAKTKAVVAVDVNGRGVDYNLVQRICEYNELVLICDAAEALGSSHNGKMLGSYGMAGCFSFSANKTITAGQGGMIVTDDDRLRKRLRQLKDQGRESGGSGGDDLHPALGFNFKWTDLQAAVALAQLDEFGDRLQSMRRRDEEYRRHLAGVPGLTIPDLRQGEVLQWFDILLDERDKVCAALDANRVEYRRFWHPLHTQKPYRTYGDADLFPNSNDISRRGLWLPSRFDLSPTDISRVCNVVKKALNVSGA